MRRNVSGYFYYTGSEGYRVLRVTHTSDIVIDKPTVLYVVGADIYIENNITYSTIIGDNPSLVIIVQKDTEGRGGNVYINPEVTHIDATLISDGALMNASLSGLVLTPLNWILNENILTNRLLINGRLLTYNTRG
jgi:hypothetical protein